jgi:cytochrome P450
MVCFFPVRRRHRHGWSLHIYVFNHLLRVLRLFAQTVSAIYSFFLAMTLFPDVQKRAQAEIDAVVGPGRLPSFADRDSLPYTEALVKEVLRWNVVLPTGMRTSFIALLF